MPINIPSGYKIDDTNPFKGKYSEFGTEQAVYLLYCDYSAAERWIKDSTTPESFFSNYLKAIQILSELKRLSSSYHFDIPTPTDQLNDLIANITVYTNYFVKRYLDKLLKSSEKLKTETAKTKRIDNGFKILLENYSEYLTPDSIEYIISLKTNTTALSSPSTDFPVYCNGRDISSLSAIKSIPNDDFSFMRPLQKAATDHKRNGNMELAIECLRKSNQISDSIIDPHYRLMDKEYTRIIDFMKYAGNSDDAEQEAIRIEHLHPEFTDKRISNLRSIKEKLDQARTYGIDIVQISTSQICPYCKHMDKKRFSISGRSNKFPKLPLEISEQGGFCSKCYTEILLCFDDLINESDTVPTIDSLTNQFIHILTRYKMKREDTPTFTRIHIYDTTNRKIGLVKITKSDMKMTFKVPGDPDVHDLSKPEDIKRFL